MKTNNGERILSTVPVISWWLSDKLEAFRRRSMPAPQRVADV